MSINKKASQPSGGGIGYSIEELAQAGPELFGKPYVLVKTALKRGVGGIALDHYTVDDARAVIEDYSSMCKGV